MKNIKIKTILLISVLILFTSFVNADESLRAQFLDGKSVICAINIRNFNSKDTNGNGIIDLDEEKGNFINAAERLDEIKKANINALHVLPISSTGKLKALGTAGSLYATADFLEINPQLVAENSKLSPKEQLKYFINEAHKRNIKIILDLPACGSYDLFLTNPELFLKNKKNLSIIPSDWMDVRLLNAGKNGALNEDLINIYKKFVDMTIEVNADGIRAGIATIKPYDFWKELISYAREKNPEILFLAEASDSDKESPSKYAEFTPYNDLLATGFDGYYGSFFNLKDWTTAKELFEHIKFNKKLLNSYPDKKNVILSFTTHDEVSPVVLHGEDFSIMICWLNATLPFNPYIVDGFSTGDTYLYPWANTTARLSETDDDDYFVHKGKLDIFNFSARPNGKNLYIADNFKNAFDFRANNPDLIVNGKFIQLKSDKDRVFAYARSNESETIIIAGNLDYKKYQKHIVIKVPGLRKNTTIDVVKGNASYKIRKNKIILDLEAGQIKVLRIKEFSL